MSDIDKAVITVTLTDDGIGCDVSTEFFGDAGFKKHPVRRTVESMLAEIISTSEQNIATFEMQDGSEVNLEF